jgi:hypothetical protein
MERVVAHEASAYLPPCMALDSAAFDYATFDYARSGFDVPPGIVRAQQKAWELLAAPGSWWTGAERIALAEQVRAARQQRTEPPWLRELAEAAQLPSAAVEAARKIAADAAKIDRSWAERQIAALGDAAYIELAAIAVTVCAIDTFADALGRALEPFPAPKAGEPDRQRLEDVEEVGAYVALQRSWQGPNVGRALSLVPAQNIMFFQLVMQMYGGEGRGFYDLEWTGPLSRPQIELIASRVSAVNECFY